MVTFLKQSTFSTADVSDNLNAKFEELALEYEGLSFSTLMDQGAYIYLAIGSITDSLLWGAVFAIIILFLFLRDLKPTFITLCSIPISLFFAIALMYFSGVTINIISLSGLAVGVGMLVDNSIVVIENIYRLRLKGLSVIEAAVSGAASIAAAITSSTLTTVCVFLPIVFVGGITRQLFTDMALTLGYSLMASLIVSLTLVPAMSSKMLQKIKPQSGKYYGRAMAGYRAALIWSLSHKAIVLISVTLLLAGSGVLVYLKGFSFMPEMNMPQVSVELTMPEDTRFEDLKTVCDMAVEDIAGIEGVESVGVMAGDDRVSAVIYALLDENAQISSRNVGIAIESLADNLPCELSASGASTMATMMSALGGSGISLELYGENLDSLREAAAIAAAALDSVEGTAAVSNALELSDPEIRFTVDKDKAMLEGLTVAQVYSEVANALTSSSSSTSVNFGGRDYDIVVKKGAETDITPEYVKNLPISVTTMDGEEKTVSLGSIASVEETRTLQSIDRYQQRRYVAVSAELADGYNTTLVTAEAERVLKGITFPDGVTYKFAGENETIMESFVELGKMLLLGILLVYLIMVAQFQSLKSPFIVMFTIPLAFTGGLIALLLAGFELSVIALISFVMLVGIIVNNGIVLVDYVNQIRAEGTDRREALIEAGITRMRPILMTTLTTILGLIVMAIGAGTGAELIQPAAVVCIGGLAYATFMTLFVIPVMYDILSKKEPVAVSCGESDGGQT